MTNRQEPWVVEAAEILHQHGNHLDACRLTRMCLEIETYLSKELAGQLAQAPKVSANLHEGFLTDQIVLRIRQEILGAEVGIVFIKRYASWWDMLKAEARWLPRWIFERLRPPCYDYLYYDARLLFPHLPVDLPGGIQGAHFCLSATSPPEGATEVPTDVTNAGLRILAWSRPALARDKKLQDIIYQHVLRKQAYNKTS